MKTWFTLLLFVLFALLCGAEVLPKFVAAANKEKGSVRYVRSAGQPAAQKQTEAAPRSYKELVKDINVHGA